MRLIDADALEKSLTEKGDDYKVSMFATSDDCNIARIVAFECAEEVKNAPTIEAELVVRCKDCKRFIKLTQGFFCTRHSGLAGPIPDGFCNYAERRDDNNDRADRG